MLHIDTGVNTLRILAKTTGIITMALDITKEKAKRLYALDLFRGLTIIGMIIVNSPNTSGQLSHAYWEGITLADLVFPFFIFIVGVSISLSSKSLNTIDNRVLVAKILKRAVLLFGLGIIVNCVYLDFAQFRLLGVLQRIAIVYAICAVMNIYLTKEQMIKTAVFILVSYWLFILFIPAPGLSAGQLTHSANIINWFDEQFLPGMLWRGTWDPEGILSNYPAIVSGIIGVISGNIIKQKSTGGSDLSSKVLSLFLMGFFLFVVGYIWSIYFPFIKQLWTSSFVLVTGGLAVMSLASLLWLTDVKGFKRGTSFAVIFGVNATFAYVYHVVFHSLLDIKIAGESIHERFVHLIASLGISDVLNSALWISLFLVCCYLPVLWLYNRKIFFKV